MALREVELRFDVTDAVAGTQYELWLKEDESSWALVGSGLADTVNPTQTFLLAGLLAATPYKVQIRQVLEGRVRNDYAALNPSSWPSQSLLEFTTGS
jgi:hypothetical protein